MKIKVFKFEVSNASSKAFSDDKQKDWYYTQQARLKTPNEIEDIINEFCKDKDVVDIKIQTVDVEYHNNGRGNTIELWYTIMYK
jgi:hypothetical protein